MGSDRGVLLFDKDAACKGIYGPNLSKLKDFKYFNSWFAQFWRPPTVLALWEGLTGWVQFSMLLEKICIRFPLRNIVHSSTSKSFNLKLCSLQSWFIQFGYDLWNGCVATDLWTKKPANICVFSAKSTILSHLSLRDKDSNLRQAALDAEVQASAAQRELDEAPADICETQQDSNW